MLFRLSEHHMFVQVRSTVSGVIGPTGKVALEAVERLRKGGFAT